MSLELAEIPSEQGNVAIPVQLGTRRDVQTRFRPGQSGNPGGRPRTALFRRFAVRELRREIADGVQRGTVILDKCATMAESGDLTAMAFLRDTVDGLPARNDTGNATNLGVAISIEHVGVEKD